MGPIGLGHAADRHVSVADRLDLLQSAAGDDVVERGEIMVEKTHERRGLGAFGQKREALKIGKQNRCGAQVARLHAPIHLELVGDRGGQKVMQEALFLNSPRDDAAPPPGGAAVSKLKLLFPADWSAFLGSKREFNNEWDRVTGLK